MALLMKYSLLYNPKNDFHGPPRSSFKTVIGCPEKTKHFRVIAPRKRYSPVKTTLSTADVKQDTDIAVQRSQNKRFLFEAFFLRM